MISAAIQQRWDAIAAAAAQRQSSASTHPRLPDSVEVYLSDFILEMIKVNSV